MHKPYKPDAKEKAERMQHHIGKRLEWPDGQQPIFEPKTVTTMVCVVCGHIFTRPEVICNRCGNCQACGGLSSDRFGNACTQCGNSVDQPRFDTLGPTIFIP